MASDASPGSTVQFETLAKGSYSSIDSRDFTTIRDQQTFQQLWQRSFSHKRPAPKLPRVDFDQYFVMALFLGRKRGGGYGIKVTHIDSHAKSLVVKVALLSPGKRCVSTQALTAPFEIIKLPATSKEILFETTATQRSC